MNIWTLTIYLKDEGITGDYSITTKNYNSRVAVKEAFKGAVKEAEAYIVKRTGTESLEEMREDYKECSDFFKKENRFRIYIEGICTYDIEFTENNIIEEIKEDNEENIFHIKVIEKLERVIEVEASNRYEAICKVEEMYNDEEIILDADDFKEVEII